MSRRFVSQLNHNETVEQVFLASNKQLRPNRQGNLYLQLDLSDRSGTIATRKWNASETDYKSFENGDFVYVDGTVQLFQGNLQLIAQRLRTARPDEVDESDYQTLQSDDVCRMRDRLIGVLRGVKSPALAALVEAYLGDEVFMEKFCRAPAGMKNHHAYQGGLLEHSLNMMEVAALIAPRYPQLNLEKLLLGVLLHDSGKVDELSYDREIAYTDEGQMLGHMCQAISHLEQKAKDAERRGQIAFPPVLLMELKHMILSHHGEYAYGSAKLPMTLEAVALHQLDNLDAKLASMSGLINDCPNTDSRWTQYFPNLDRKLWKGV
ncbi:3'-5' exoribonuclease YhaM family protein [Botrimarina hoheduenensis]|uniref:3'-5' exoribonuclease YhaM n=1 Tax=Botrimarina hoheduenensis TaxID=2528000 RepID=A0A5C5VV86_9BACT|nr:HD domain-containing protein [Botrimarina hoheduenensis]TWT42498.1 3'-5' exoribonuclease YhaM [Botrimarina hoheduenensis]